MPHQMHEMMTIATDNPAEWASVSLLVCQLVSPSRERLLNVDTFTFARWRHFDAAITTLL